MDADRIPLSRPCPLSFCELKLDARNTCGNCGKQVVDLSAGTEAEAESFLARGTRACVAYLVDAGGRVIFGRSALTTGLAVAAGAAVSLAPQLEPTPGCEAPAEDPVSSNHILRAMEEARVRFAVEEPERRPRPVTVPMGVRVGEARPRRPRAPSKD